MTRKLFISILLAITFFIQSDSMTMAVTPPDFPSCLNPQGDVKISYESGTHGIVGNNQTYIGSDTVYTLPDNLLSQCFCSENGEGIQTNWWKVSSLTENEVQQLKNDGWFFVPNGTLWGLQEGSYMAKNSTYACRSQNGSVSGVSDSSAGSVLGASTGGSVLGLASTGTIQAIMAFFSLGILLITSGLYNKKFSS